MTTDNRANEPTPEQILVDEWIRQADRAKSMTGMDAIWFPDAKETLAVLRTHGLLSEGAPSEAQARAIRKLDNVQAILAGAQASVTDAVRELSLTSAALTAAQGAAPQAESEDNVTCRCGHGTGSHDFSDQQEPCREIVCDCRGWFGVSPVLPSSGVDEDALAEELESCLEAGSFDNGDTSEPIWFTDDVKALAAHLAEWLKGQGGESRGE